MVWWRKCWKAYHERTYLRLAVGPTTGIFTCLLAYNLGVNLIMAETLGLTMFMVIWWLEGMVRMGLTGLLPIVLLPCLGVVEGNVIAKLYFSDSVIVCLGSLIMAHAVETYKLHHAGAQLMLSYCQQRGVYSILAAFIFTTGFLSMWLSNTATAALMIPLSSAMIDHLDAHPALLHGKSLKQVGAAIDLSIAFAASLGGMATLTGTGSNLVLQGTMTSLFGIGEEITFLSWFIVAAPLTIVNLCLLWWIVCLCFLTVDPTSTSPDAIASTLNATWQQIRSCWGILNGQRATHLSTNNNEFMILSTSIHVEEVGNPLDVSRGQADQSQHGASHGNYDDSNVSIELKEFSKVNSFVIEDEEDSDREDDEVIEFQHSMSRRKQHFPEVPAMIKSQSQTTVEATIGNNEKRELTYAEYVVMLTFLTMALLWMTRDPPGGWGWSKLLSHGSYATDGTVAMAACLFLLIAPAEPPFECKYCKSRQEKEAPIIEELEEDNSSRSGHGHATEGYKAILPWTAVQTLNWDIIFLLGGGFALSEGFQQSGLSEWLAAFILANGPKSLHGFTIIACIIACFCTNIMSNVAAANVLLPSLACVAPHYGYSPLTVLTPVALSISLAFLFPIGTPPNAIVLANKRVSIVQMCNVGSICTVVYLVTTILYCFLVMPYLMNSHQVSASVQSACNL